MFYFHRTFERKSKDNEVLFKHLQFFPELADQVPSYVLKELCSVAQIEKCPEEDYAGSVFTPFTLISETFRMARMENSKCLTKICILPKWK